METTASSHNPSLTESSRRRATHERGPWAGFRGSGLWGRPSWPRRLEPRCQPWTLDEKHAINEMYSYFGPPRPSSG